MERHTILEMMGTLKLAGMRHANDKLVADAVKREHSAQRVVGDLLKAEIEEKQARSIRYQMTIAKLPQAKEVTGFDFAATPINEGLMKDLATGGFLASQRNAVLVGGHRHRQDPPRHCDRPRLRARWCQGSLLQLRRLGEPA